ncbi:hypothetical protein BDW67DRAFT_179570 [Aspergillus spinulosporus]
MSNHQDASNYFYLAHLGSTRPRWAGHFKTSPAVDDSTSSGSRPPEAGDNDVYTYNDASEGYAEVDGYGSPDLRVETISVDNGEGSTVYDPESGAYDQMLDYTTGSGEYRHYRERMTEDGVFHKRDVTKRQDGTRHVHREYENTLTGTRRVTDYEQ